MTPRTISIGMVVQFAAAFSCWRYMFEVAGMYRNASPARRLAELLAAEPWMMPMSCNDT